MAESEDCKLIGSRLGHYKISLTESLAKSLYVYQVEGNNLEKGKRSFCTKVMSRFSLPLHHVTGSKNITWLMERASCLQDKCLHLLHVNAGKYNLYFTFLVTCEISHGSNIP